MIRFKVPVRFNPTVVMYLVIIDQLVKKEIGLLKTRPTEQFFTMVHEHVMAYVLEGKEPPAQIAAAVMNIADDVMAGREVGIRAGDYIALMNFAKAEKRV